MPDFSMISKGDELVRLVMHGKDAIVYIVTHTSEKHFDAEAKDLPGYGSMRFRKRDGVCTTNTGVSLQPLTELTLERANETLRLHLALTLGPKLRTLTLEALREVATLVEREGQH